MNYKEIRGLLMAEKRSKPSESTQYEDYADFAVCFDSNGKPFLVDSEVVEIIAKRKWCRNKGYPCANVGGKVLHLHDCVMALKYENKPDNVYVDHINRDKSDNRTINLRFLSPKDSALNMPLRKNNTTGAKGVSRTKEGRYRAYITVNSKQKSLGQYDTIEEAIEARRKGEAIYGYL